MDSLGLLDYCVLGYWVTYLPNNVITLLRGLMVLLDKRGEEELRLLSVAQKEGSDHVGKESDGTFTKKRRSLTVENKRSVMAILACIVWAAFFLAACATFSSQTPEESLQERVTAYMQARVDDRWNDVYDCFDKSIKESVSREEFAAQPSNMDFTGFQIDSIDVADSGKEAQVVVKVDFNVQGFDFKGTPQKQTWIKEGRSWYIKQRITAKPPFE